MIWVARTIVGLLLLSCLIALVWLFWPATPSYPIIRVEGDPERGAYLARASGCVACHTDTENGGALLAGGAPMVTDVGTFAAPNITRDPNNGLGGWTINDFAVAVRQGVSPEGHYYYPAFPWRFYQRFSDQAIADLWSALATVPNQNKDDPEQHVRFPFSVRAGLKVWRQASADLPAETPVSPQADPWVRGRFLVEGPAHCAACHTPRNALGVLQVDDWFAGSDQLPGGEWAPPIDAATLQDRGWTIDDLAFALETGITPEGDVLGGSMAEVISEGTQYLTWEDLVAMATYLLSTHSVEVNSQ